jgi:hypothetical protein
MVRETSFPIRTSSTFAVSAPEVAMDVGKAFLDDAKNSEFHFLGKTPEGGWDLEVDLKFLAALLKAARVPSKRAGQARFVQERRMQAVRHRVDFVAEVPE